MSIAFASFEDRLHDEAMAATGLDDFGDPIYRVGLRQLLAAREASGIDYPSDGAMISGAIAQKLAARLRTIDRLKRFDGPLPAIERPIFILGLPRTGTTAMQRLLMADPQMQGLEYWLGEEPRPRPPRGEWQTDPDYLACEASIEAIDAAAPMVGHMHHMSAGEGEECRLVMEQSFAHSSFSLVSPLRPYQDWLFGTDLTPHYAHFKRTLQLIGANDPGRTWVLKCPHHAPQVDSLLRVFPDARIVFMHRPVADLVPSVVRLAEAFLGLLEGEALDMAERAPMIVENLDLTLRRLLDARRDNPGSFYDLTMDRFVADPLAAATAVYERFDIAMPEESETAMQAWCAQNHDGAAKAAASSALPYGLDREALEERFSYYKG